MKFRRANGTIDSTCMSDVKRAINFERLYKLIKEVTTRQSYKRYSSNLRECRSMIRNSKCNHEKRIARESKSNLPKFFLLYIRTNKWTKNNTGLVADEPGVSTKNRKHMARILNTNVALVFTIESIESTSESAPPPRGIEVLKIGIIENMKWNLSLTIGQGLVIYRRGSWKKLKQQILQSTSIYNRSVQLNKGPYDLKLENVTLIFRKGNKSVALGVEHG